MFMNGCPVCGISVYKRDGMIRKAYMHRRGKRIGKIQLYRCQNGHQFRKDDIPPWDDSFIEYVVFVYLLCLSLNTTIDLVREMFEIDILSKGQILNFIEIVADQLPTIDDIDRIYNPTRSGYLALDGVWFQYEHEQIVLLVAFDPETFDIIGARWAKEETQKEYELLITDCVNKVGILTIKGVYGDGDNGLIEAKKHLLPDTPFQTCVFHKELRMGQIIPIKSVKHSKQLTPYQKHDIKVFQLLFREVIYAETKEKSYEAFDRLKSYAESNTHQYPEKFMKAYRSLARNFKYTLTHFDYPHMRRDNNLLECFNSCLKPRLKLMKGFKRQENLDRYLKLFLLEFRFHPLKESRFDDRRGNCPLEVAGVYLPKYYNFLKFLRTSFNLTYQPK
jgi:hypothetical protein